MEGRRAGVADASDNCPADENPDQHNEDGDSAGDHCDDCPLVANTQGADEDGDGAGDLCDPQPTTAGDCLLVVESFRDPTTFAASWEVVTTLGPTAIEQRTDEVVLRPTTEPVTILERTASGRVDVTVRARTTTRIGIIAATSNVTDPSTTYACALAQKEMSIQAIGPGVSPDVTKPLFPQSHVGDAVLLRLAVVANAGAGPDVVVGCRADYGIATGIDLLASNTTLAAGRAGVGATLQPVVIEAIALSQHEATGACPPTIYR